MPKYIKTTNKSNVQTEEKNIKERTYEELKNLFFLKRVSLLLGGLLLLGSCTKQQKQRMRVMQDKKLAAEVVKAVRKTIKNR